jgi:hypothetical protein
MQLLQGQPVERGESPPDLRGYPKDALGNIKRDDTPPGTTYGDVLIDVESQYTWVKTSTIFFCIMFFFLNS